jgi:hypothetical protein
MTPRYLGAKTIRNVEGGTFNPEADSVYQIPSNLTQMANGEHKRKVVTLRNPQNSKTVVRLLRGKSQEGFTANETIVNYATMRELGITVGDRVEVKSSNLWDQGIIFYWNHPELAIRLAFKMGLLAVVLSIISIIPAILPLLKSA